MQINPLFERQCELGESAYWHPKDGCLYWVDIKGHRIHCYKPHNDSFQFWQLDGLVSDLCATELGDFIIGYQDKIASFNPDNGKVEILWDSNTGMRMNHGLIGPKGNYWIGQADDEGKRRAKLFRFDPDGTIDVMETGLQISNGLDWDLQRERFYLADSPLRVIYVYQYDNDNNHITNRCELIRFGENDGYPDGFVLDSEGHLWVCMWDGHKIVRVSPEGDVVQTIEMPVARPTTCSFGGPDFKTLYVTSACSNVGSDEQLAKPNGYVFEVEVDVPGRPMTIFGEPV